MLTIQILSSVLLLSASVFAQAADKPCNIKAAQKKQWQKVVRESGRGNWGNWQSWATRNGTRPAATSSDDNAKPVETFVELPESISAPAEDARPRPTRSVRPTTTRSVRPTTTRAVRPPSVKPTTSAKPTTTKRPQTTTRSSTSQKPVETSPASGNLSAFAKTAVDGHNAERALHGADPVVWDQELAVEAQKWTDRCVWEHGGGKSTGSGENLASGASMEGAVKMWAAEKKDYKQGNGFSAKTGHFTQVVWKNTQKIGCGSSDCDGMYSPFISCIYYPPGNYLGQFDDQVQAAVS